MVFIPTAIFSNMEKVNNYDIFPTTFENLIPEFTSTTNEDVLLFKR